MNDTNTESDLTSAERPLLDLLAAEVTGLRRQQTSHKASFGLVVVIGGASGMCGAALLAARSALFCGAGRVVMAALEPVAVDPLYPELMCRRLEDSLALLSDPPPQTIVAIGPGLGQSDRARAVLAEVLKRSLPLVIDADALNLLAAHEDLRQTCATRSAVTLLTPHPLEAARLLAVGVEQVLAERSEAAVTIAKRYRATVVVKGHASVMVAADQLPAFNPSGNAALAVAGSGDVLCGLVAALLAQRLGPWAAMRLGVYVHGRAADRLVASGIGPLGVVASALLPEARAELNHLVRQCG